MNSPRNTLRWIRLGLVLAMATPALAYIEHHSTSNLPPPLPEKVVPLPYPAALIATVKSHPMRVVGAKSGKPCADVGGRVKPLTSKARLMLLRARSFAPGFIRISNQQAKSSWGQRMIQSGGATEPTGDVVDASSVYSASLRADTSYGDCFIVLLKFDRRFLNGGVPSPYFRFGLQDVGKLKAGVAKTVTIKMNLPGSDVPDTAYIPLVFSDGVEIPTSLDTYTGALLRKVEEAEHAAVVKKYVGGHAGADEPVKPYALPSPVFPAGLDRTALPKTIDASFEVTTDGGVRNLKLMEKVPAPAAKAIRRALSEWLFLPQIKGGHAVSTEVEVPININGGAGRQHGHS